MKYIQRLLDKKRDIPISGTLKTLETPSSKSGNVPCEVPSKPSKPGFDGFEGTQDQESPDFTRPWLPRPAELASWPLDRREQWGRLANRLEDEGVPFPDSERRAFDQVKAEMEVRAS